MQNQASRQVFDYWIHLSGERAAPQRTQIDPVALRRFLPHLFIASGNPEGEISFRLAGTRICDLFGREFRGSPFASMWLGDESIAALEVVESVILDERPALLGLRASKGEESHAYEMLLLPVRSGEIASDRVLGALVPQHDPFPETALPAAGLTLDSWTFLERDGEASAMNVDDSNVSPLARIRRLLPVNLFSPNRAS